MECSAQFIKLLMEQGGTGRKEIEQHGISCALALCRRKKDIFNNLKREEDHHHALIELIEKETE